MVVLGWKCDTNDGVVYYDGCCVELPDSSLPSFRDYFQLSLLLLSLLLMGLGIKPRACANRALQCWAQC